MRTFETKYDEHRPVRNVRTRYDHQSHAMNVTFEHSCRLRGQHPAAYNITIIDMVTNASSTIRVNSIGDNLQIYQYRNVTRGAVYSIRFAAVVNDAEPYDGVFVAPPLPSPAKVEASFEEDDDVVKLVWQEVDFNETS